MNIYRVLLIATLLAACSEKPTEVTSVPSHITVYVYWAGQGLSGKQVALLQTADTLTTDSAGLATFTIPPGRYTVRAFNINRGGPAYRYIDFDVEARAGDTTRLNVFDCLACF